MQTPATTRQRRIDRTHGLWRLELSQCMTAIVWATSASQRPRRASGEDGQPPFSLPRESRLSTRWVGRAPGLPSTNELPGARERFVRPRDAFREHMPTLDVKTPQRAIYAPCSAVSTPPATRFPLSRGGPARGDKKNREARRRGGGHKKSHPSRWLGFGGVLLWRT